MAYKLIYLARRNPAIAIEDWPSAWRSHARFVGQFANIGASIDSVFYCARIPSPMLDGVPFDPPSASRDHDGVGIIAAPSAEALLFEQAPEDRAMVDADELRVFEVPVRDFSFHCRETLVHGGAPGAVVVIRFLARKPGSSAEEFEARWRDEHGTIAVRAADSAGTVGRYVHNCLTAPPPTAYPFDGISETWFANEEEALGSFLTPAFTRLADDLSSFCDLQRSVTMLTGIIHRWPQGFRSSQMEVR